MKKNEFYYIQFGYDVEENDFSDAITMPVGLSMDAVLVKLSRNRRAKSEDKITITKHILVGEARAKSVNLS